jgi:hypothetical protein
MAKKIARTYDPEALDRAAAQATQDIVRDLMKAAFPERAQEIDALPPPMEPLPDEDPEGATADGWTSSTRSRR